MKILIVVLILLFNISAYSENYKDLTVQELKQAVKADDEVAMSYLGETYEKGLSVEKDLDKAIKWYERAAELNYAPAQYNLAVLLSYEETGKIDLPQAFFWAEKSAEQNYPASQFLLGSFYAQGKGTYENKQKAQKWYEKAADQDNILAQFNLAIMLLKGEGVNQDKEEGMKLLKKAAKSGHLQAQTVLDLINQQQ